MAEVKTLDPIPEVKSDEPAGLNATQKTVSEPSNNNERNSDDKRNVSATGNADQASTPSKPPAELSVVVSLTGDGFIHSGQSPGPLPSTATIFFPAMMKQPTLHRISK